MYEINIIADDRFSETYKSKFFKYINDFKETIGKRMAQELNEKITYSIYQDDECIETGEIKE